ncbi:hypothetical protein, partial [Ralstonia pseudosolanacearum]|uniref:hypothetical protein n=1 Tax=Ralstonia pseudosolanacearum TaxID=1310165 RepID=UPI003D16AC8B
MQEVLQEAADIIEPGTEHVVQELPQGVASIGEADAKHPPEVSQEVLDASELGAEDVQESSPQGVSYAFELDAKHVQESSQQGVSNVSEFDADISELDSKHFVEVLPQGGLDAPDASEIDPDHTQELPQRVSAALESDAVHLPEVLHAIPDENQMTGKHE